MVGLGRHSPAAGWWASESTCVVQKTYKEKMQIPAKGVKAERNDGGKRKRALLVARNTENSNVRRSKLKGVEWPIWESTRGLAARRERLPRRGLVWGGGLRSHRTIGHVSKGRHQ